MFWTTLLGKLLDPDELARIPKHIAWMLFVGWLAYLGMPAIEAFARTPDKLDRIISNMDRVVDDVHDCVTLVDQQYRRGVE